MTETKNILEGEAMVLFSPILAKAFGHCEALLIQQIHYWGIVKPNRPKEGGGFSWHFNTYDAWAKQVAYSPRQVRRAFKKLEDLKVVATGVFNHHKYDRTRWYRVDYSALPRALEVLLGGIWQVGTDSNGPKGRLHVARMSLPIPKTTTENIIENKTSELALAKAQAEESNAKTVGGVDLENSREANGKLNAAPKPVLALEAHWKRRISECPSVLSAGIAFVSSKERGQLKHLANQCGDQTREVIDYAIAHWQDFAIDARESAGLKTYPSDPNIGFLLAHCAVAITNMQLIASKQAAKATTHVVKAPTSVHCPTFNPSIIPEGLPTLDEVKAIMLKYGFGKS